jgi:hypothetical protein
MNDVVESTKYNQPPKLLLMIVLHKLLVVVNYVIVFGIVTFSVGLRASRIDNDIDALEMYAYLLIAMLAILLVDVIIDIKLIQRLTLRHLSGDKITKPYFHVLRNTEYGILMAVLTIDIIGLYLGWGVSGPNLAIRDWYQEYGSGDSFVLNILTSNWIVVYFVAFVCMYIYCRIKIMYYNKKIKALRQARL